MIRIPMVVALLALACDTKTEPTPAPAPTVVTAPAPEAAKPAIALTVTPAAALGTVPEGTGLLLGTSIPDVTIANLGGKPVGLKALAAARPLLVIFYRGGWCPYCNAQVHELAARAGEFDALGVGLVLISVDKPEEGTKTRTAHTIPFPVLSDPDLVAHEAFKVVHAAGPEEVDKLKGYGIDLEASSGRTHHKIAIPSVFLFAGDGKLVWQHADAAYKIRPSTDQLLGVARTALAAK